MLVSYFVTEDLVNRSIALVEPTIKSLLGTDLVEGRKNIHIVVIEPDGKMFEHTIAEDPIEQWKYRYDQIARSKARLCKESGKPSGHVLWRTPWLFKNGHARYAGGVVEDGLVVAISGLQSHFDEMLSWMIFNAIAGLCMDAVAQIQKDPDAPHFIGENTCPNCGAFNAFSYATAESLTDAQGTCTKCGYLYRP